MSAAARAGMLDGVRIVDMTAVIMGPYGSRILADLGADVIKIESPAGDSTRAYRPHLTTDISALYLTLNRNKRSIVLDLKTDEGRQTLEQLLETADVFMHNLRAPVMERLGFGYERCRGIKPDIIYCASYGFGADGPYAAKPAYDDLIQAASGFASLSEGLIGEPTYAPSVICDKIAGQAIATAILAALVHKLRTGEGQSIEVPMFEVAIDFNLVDQFGGTAFVPPRGDIGYARIRSPERKPFATADGYACILPYSDRNWRDFFQFVGRDDLMADPRFRTIGTRQDFLGQLYAEVRKEAVRYTTNEWVSFCDSVDIPCAPVVRIENIFDDPHVEAVDLFETVEHPEGGHYRSIRSPVRSSAAPWSLRHHAPSLGQHGQEILAELVGRPAGQDAAE